MKVYGKNFRVNLDMNRMNVTRRMNIIVFNMMMGMNRRMKIMTMVFMMFVVFMMPVVFVVFMMLMVMMIIMTSMIGDMCFDFLVNWFNDLNNLTMGSDDFLDLLNDRFGDGMFDNMRFILGMGFLV